MSLKTSNFVISGGFNALLGALAAGMAIRDYRAGDWFWFVVSSLIALWSLLLSYQLASAMNFWQTISKMDKDQKKPSDPPNAKV